MNIRHTLVFLIMITGALASASAQSAKVTRAYADESGAVHVVYSDGKEKIIHKLRGSVGVEDVKTATDGLTIGWLITWPNPDELRKWETLPGTLVVWRNGKIIRQFTATGVFEGWTFWKGSEQVACQDSPLHGPSYGYDLYDVTSGRLVEHIPNDDAADTDKLPDWVKVLWRKGAPTSSLRMSWQGINVSPTEAGLGFDNGVGTLI